MTLMLALGGCQVAASDVDHGAAALLQAEYGRALVQQFECARCHDGLPAEVPAVRLEKHCVQCHRAIIAGTFDASPETLAAWRANVTSLRAVPTLEGAGAMLRPGWIAAFLQNPHDVRPHLAATMPRLPLSAPQAEAIARYLTTANAPRMPALGLAEAAPTWVGYLGDVVHGVSLYRTYQCHTCHRFAGSALDQPLTADAIASEVAVLAPDLAHTRQRMAPPAVMAWLQAARAVRPGTQMPSYGFTAAQARALATLLAAAPLSPVGPPAPPERLPVLTRPVTYEEVSTGVFRKVCWHCHAQPDYALGDGGPGNTGGFGFAPRRLDLSSATGLAAGALGADGRRHSVFAPTADGTPLLVEVLLLRQREAVGQPDRAGRLRGMPLGLPPLSAAQIQLVETWIAQGRPQ